MGCAQSSPSSGSKSSKPTSAPPTEQQQQQQQQWPAVESLRALNLSKVESYIPRITRGFVAKVYDGDSITLLGYNEDVPPASRTLLKFSVRLSRIDCPEVRSSSAAEKALGLRAKQVLGDLLLHRFVRVAVEKMDKYGRLLAEVLLDPCQCQRQCPCSCRVPAAPDATATRLGNHIVSLDDIDASGATRLPPPAPQQSVSDWLLGHGLALPYDGGTKRKFDAGAFAPLP